MIGRKTASLIAGSVQAGAMLATDDQIVVDAYRRFGWALGLAFQLNDDLLGIWGDEAATGKEPSDIEARKQTLPLIHALEHTTGPDRARLAAILHANGPSTDEIREARDLVERSGSREFTRQRARAYRDEAIEHLERSGVIDGEAMERLRLIVSSAIAA
jgi:geranylgeranyl diphosphate synthase type I